MNKNKIVGSLGVLVTSLFFGCGQKDVKSNEPVQPKPVVPVVEQPKIVVGENLGVNLKVNAEGEYDEEFSKKILELSRLILTKPKEHYFIDSLAGKFFVCANFEENGSRYNLVVSDSSENNGYKTPDKYFIHDSISLAKFTQEENNLVRTLTFSDYGLSGNYYAGYSYTLNINSLERTDLVKCDVLFKETADKEFFDKKFRELVDELLIIYKKE